MWTRHLRRLSTYEENMRKVGELGMIWDKYRMRVCALPPEQDSITISRRDDASFKRYLNLRLYERCPMVVLRRRNESFVSRHIDTIRSYHKELSISGLNVMPEGRDAFFDSVRGVFFEILASYSRNDFSNIEQFVLGGKRVLDFHSKRANRLTDMQREAFRISNDDLLGCNGYLLDSPIMEGSKSIGAYFHHIQRNVDENAMGEKVEEENSKLMVYRVVMGALYKQNMLYEHVAKMGEYWTSAIKKPTAYPFISPRYTFVEMDICQKENGQKQLETDRLLYDFSLYSF